MFLGLQERESAEQSGIIGVKIPFDPNIIISVWKSEGGYLRYG